MTIGYVLKSEYFLPDNTSTIQHFLREPFDPLTRPLERRRRNAPLIADQNQSEAIELNNNGTENSDHYEKYNVEAVQISTGLTKTEDGNGYDSSYSDEWNGMQEDEEYSPADYRITKQNDFTTARWTLYKGIEAMAERLSCLKNHSFLLSLKLPFTII